MIWVILFVFTLLSLPSRVSAAVVVNEIFPKSADIAYTWVELYNTGNESVSLDRWKLENENGKHSYTLNASAIIEPRGFLIFYQTQTGITFNVEGDSVHLFDDKNNLVESKSYPGTLGYNTSMGRSTDGGAGWMTCAPSTDYVATPNASNKCPPPAATTTALPTATREPTRPQIPIPSEIPATPTTIERPSTFTYPPTQTPTPTPAMNFFQSDAYQHIWTYTLITGVSLAILIMCVGLYKSICRK